MNYTLNQLQIFLKIAKTASITKAAEELHLTQPAVSIQLRNFQAQFRIPLTETIGRKIYITDFGKEIATAAAVILEHVHAINYKSAAYEGRLVGKLKISAVSTGKYVIPYFLAEFMKLHPEIELSVDVTNKKNVVETLENNKVDFSLVSILPKNLEIEKLDLLQNKLFLVGNSAVAASGQQDSSEIFRELPLIFREKGSGTRQAMEDFISRNSISVLEKLELTSNEAVKQAIIAGMGYSVMPLIGLKNEIMNADLQIIPIKKLPIKTMWSLVWLKDKKHTPAARAYLDYLCQQKDKIIASHFGWYEAY
ncbi:MAG TPA: LysR family transcriptional regulator [Flavobacterium sp.]|nr:LysR family transcriptional regulator [Flavobacterium sp.]